MINIEINAPPICEYCKKSHDGSYGSGRFCSEKCARSYSSNLMTDGAKTKRIESMKKYYESRAVSKKRNHHNYITYSPPTSSLKDAIHMNKKELGLVGESGILHKFKRHRIDTYIPYGDNTRADLIADFGGKPQRIQIKTSTVSNDEVVLFRPTQSTYKVINGKLDCKRKKYTSDEIDYFALYDYNSDRAFLININELKNNNTIILRYTEPKNGQKTKINYADDYDFDKVLNEIEFVSQDIIDAEDFEVITDK